MKKLLAISALLLSSVSQADVIKCTFTEPFFNTTYSMTQSTLTYIGDGQNQVLKNISFQIKSAGVFQLVARGGKVVQTLTLDNQGSNGMSDKVYPYSAVETSNVMTPDSLQGGCESNYLKGTEPVN